MLAALAGDERLTECLLEYGASTTMKDQSGKTALDLCLASQNDKCINLLKENNSEPKTSKNVKETSETENSFSKTSSSEKTNKKFKNLLEAKASSSKKYQSEPNLNTDTQMNDEYDDDNENSSQLDTEEKIAATKSKSDNLNTWSESETSESHSHHRNKTALSALRPSQSEGMLRYICCFFLVNVMVFLLD